MVGGRSMGRGDGEDGGPGRMTYCERYLSVGGSDNKGIVLTVVIHRVTSTTKFRRCLGHPQHLGRPQYQAALRDL